MRDSSQDAVGEIAEDTADFRAVNNVGADVDAVEGVGDVTRIEAGVVDVEAVEIAENGRDVLAGVGEVDTAVVIGEFAKDRLDLACAGIGNDRVGAFVTGVRE